MITSQWKKATRSNPSGNCLECRNANGEVQVRDTKLGDASPVLVFSEQDWICLLDNIKSGVTYPAFGQIEVWSQGNGYALLDVDRPADALIFTPAEWDAFTEGVRANEFDLQPV